MELGSIIEKAYPEDQCVVDSVVRVGLGLASVTGTRIARSVAWATCAGLPLVETKLLGRVYVGGRRHDVLRTQGLVNEILLSQKCARISVPEAELVAEI